METTNVPGDDAAAPRHLAGLVLFAARYCLSGPDEEVHRILGNAAWWGSLEEAGLAPGQPSGSPVDLEQHRSLYQAFFWIPGNAFVPPYEQAYREGKATVDSSATAACTSIYRVAGYDAAPFDDVQRDHIGHQLRFLSALLEREADCRDQDDIGAASRVVSWEEGFLAEHCWWWPRFTERVLAMDPPAEMSAAVLLIAGLHAAMEARKGMAPSSNAGRPVGS